MKEQGKGKVWKHGSKTKKRTKSRNLFNAKKNEVVILVPQTVSHAITNRNALSFAQKKKN